LSSAENETAEDGSATEAPTEGEPTEEVEEEEPAPVDEAREALVERFRAELGDGVVEHHIEVGRDTWVRVANDAWQEAGRVAQGAMGMEYLDFLSAMDWMESPYGRSEDSSVDVVLGRSETAEVSEEIVTGYAGGDTRFQVFARISNLINHTSLTLKVDLPDETVGSWIEIYAGVSWHEREAWEMFGLNFEGHPALRALYLPGDFEGHPLRKDFPLLARHVKPWPGIVDVEPMPGEDEPEEANAEAGA